MNPQGPYTKVSAIAILGGSGTLNGGAGTFDGTTFSCGPFAPGDLPEVGKTYNLTGTHNGQFYQFQAWKCVNAGPTSDFQA